MEQLVIAGISLGLLSSFHCVGMCGPIAFALPVHTMSPFKKNLSVIFYHLGRILTYSSLGLIFGVFGRTFHIAGLQQWVSIISGLLILFFFFQYLFMKNPAQPAFIRTAYTRIQSGMAGFLRSRKPAHFLPLGMLNGLLPCGMVYVAIAATLNTESIWNGALFMAVFGLGTLPAMLAISLFGYAIKPQIRNGMKKAVPFFVATVAILLILRGLNLGIPFISPRLPAEPGEAIHCEN